MQTEAVKLSRLRLGDILLARRLVTREQLHEGLGLAQGGAVRLGEALVQLSHLAETDLKRALSEQLGVAFEPSADLILDPEVARLLPESSVEQLKALPLRMQAGQLIVAVTDPLNFGALDEVALKTGQTVRPLLVTDVALKRATVKVFGIPEADPADQRPLSHLYDIQAHGDNPIVRMVNTILAQAIQSRASDIHIEPLEDRVRVRIRVDGTLLESTPVPLSSHAPLISRLKVMAGMDIAERRLPQDGQIMIVHEGQRIDLRINTVPIARGERLVIRLLHRRSAVMDLKDLGMPAGEEAHYREMISRPNGLILVTGPTGSGKSTTLISTLASLNRPGVNILTIEDPVEYHVPGIGQVQVNPRAGLTFSLGLRAFLRQDPDILMIGEIRDRETAESAIRAALTGHLVFSTLHTNQAAGAVSRLIDMGIEPFLLASALLGVVAQRLVRVLCSRCKQTEELPDDSPLRFLPGMPQGPLRLYGPKGCGFCDQLGYRGRQAVFEVLTVNRQIRELMLARASTSAIQDEAVRLGLMRTLWTTGLEQALQGRTTIDEVRKVAFTED